MQLKWKSRLKQNVGVAIHHHMSTGFGSKDQVRNTMFRMGTERMVFRGEQGEELGVPVLAFSHDHESYMVFLVYFVWD